MNTQDILRHGRTRLDAELDNSEYYDYELVENVIGKVDVILDYSEFYDYTLGDNSLDYIYYETFVTEITGKYLMTEDSCIITTEDNCMIEYV
jgi:hypothetical protein